jgi:hypothetical protein
MVQRALASVQGTFDDFTAVGVGGFGSRMGHVLEYVSQSTLFLFGGKQGGSCVNDAWASADGTSWSSAHSASMPRPSGAFDSPTAVDSIGCLWLLGGDCNDKKGSFWKTCDVGATWTEVVRPMVTPVVATNAVLPTFPNEFIGHAIAVLGGWQLVIVDSAGSIGGGVWTFVDKEAQLVQKVAEAPMPFGQRAEPRLMATSGGLLYLVGGNSCSDAACSDNSVFNDVWRSDDAGALWTCVAVHYAASLFSEDSSGIGQYVAAAISQDDTIFLAGGRIANSTLGLSTVFYSHAGVADSTFEYSSSHLLSFSYASLPNGTMIRNFTLCFMEGVQIGNGEVQLLDMGSTPSVTIDSSVAVEGPRLTITSSAALNAANQHVVNVPAGFVKDSAGNDHPGVSVSFYVDSVPPVVTAAFPAGAGIAPWNTVMLRMNEIVLKGFGTLDLVPSVGSKISLDVSTSLIVGRKVFFDLPIGVRLTEGQEYSIVVPDGLLIDRTGNAVSAIVAGTFVVFSGSHTSNNYLGGAGMAAQMKPSMASTSGLYTSGGLRLLSTFPLSGATDVPAALGISILLFFSEPVRFSAAGIISFRNTAGNILASLSSGTDAANFMTFPQYNAAQVRVPLQEVQGVSALLLRRGHTFNVTIPAGAIEDLNGNPYEEISVSFTCLAGMSDIVPPVVRMSAPFNRQPNVPSTTSVLDVYFSEAVQAGPTGSSIVLQRPSGSSGDLHFDVSGPDVTIVGPKLSVALLAGALDLPGSYTVQIPPGVVIDLGRTTSAGQSEGGDNSLYQDVNVTFTVVVDTDGPVLDVASSLPSHELTPQFSRSPSTGFILTFNERVQAGSGSVVLTPRFTSTPVHMPAQAASLRGMRAFMTPAAALLPGEVYSISVEANAFLDVYSNPGLPWSQPYTISISPQLGFSQLGNTQFGGTRRYASGIAVDGQNSIWLVGGADGAEGAYPDASLNDMWRLNTLRGSNCASSFEPR